MNNRKAFTLVEMLVATGLVVLMMLLFAQVFQISAGLVSQQKGMANLDQDVRTMTILLRGDMGQRSFRDVVPFYPGQETDGSVGPRYSANQRQGFFSISENDPDNDTDDVLHLTIKVNEGEAREGSPQLPFAGKATLLKYPDDPESDDLIAYLLDNPNQPEWDDGQLFVNGTGMSRFAEVCWFLRNGILYRRQFLIREPYDTRETGSDQPRTADGEPLIPGDYSLENVQPNPQHDAAGRFWYDFDYAAFHDPEDGLRFHTAEQAMENKHPLEGGLGSFPEVPPSLGIPILRYGNSIRRGLDSDTPASPPREFLAGDDPATYIGRFTMQETAHSAFTYPHTSPETGDPFQDGTGYTLGNDFLVSEFSDETGRRGEDIVMTNVHAFDIKVWDDIVQDFVDIGHNQTGTVLDPDGNPVPNVPGWFNESRNRNAIFGNSFDTWHPTPEMPEPSYAPFGDPWDSPNDERIDRNNADNLGLGDIEEVPLRGIQINIRFFDVGSDSMRDMTFTFTIADK